MGEVTLAFFYRIERMCISSTTRDGVRVLVADCLSFYSCQTVLLFQWFIFLHSSITANTFYNELCTSKVSRCNQRRFVCHLLACCLVIEVF